ncbi:M23 family metallopeptidase [Micromonospora peucetia]|uniref:M23 family metallopeptidase n=1 Tax=Micromonospora peucetia TaxID=47871 RepID=A0A1C6VF78_9ACTN|nr:M23 family metallopeptidase [Micromonospora peucetia]MCX4389743.1 M23 family metallopeptidase [Micromonospora peucetia]WSA30212.1 M23 family metallopeptidase [Micromonospora peucetia]SCL64945.1 Peptidase family M23 [Micromonospora peucetia]
MTGEMTWRRLRAFVVAAVVLCGLALVPAQPASAQNGAMIQPVGGRVTGVLASRCGSIDSDHYGVDIAGNNGMAIGAAYPGTVVVAGWVSGGGNMVTVSHAGGYQTRYLHMAQQPAVVVGQQVGQGQVLGYVGSTGNSTGPHLHFEIRRNGAVYNIAPAYSCGGTVTKGAVINLSFPDLAPPAEPVLNRFAFVNSAGVLYVKDGAYSSWQAVNSGGASKVALSGNWIGWAQGGNFYAKDGIYGEWLTLASGGQVRDIAVSGNRFAFVNSAGVLYAKDGAYSSWQAVNSGGASKVALSGNWIGWAQGGNFYAKDGIYGEWLTLASGGQVRDIAVSGNRFAFVNSAGVLYAKDGAYSSWQAVNSGGASKVALSGNWIGWAQGGNFYAKDGIYGEWLTLAGGGQVGDIAVSGHDWFAFVGGGNFFAKQGLYAGWLTMGSGGQVGDIDITT